MTISEHARKLARHIATQSTAIDSQDETWLTKHIQQAIDAAISDLIRQGMGEAPVSEEQLEGIRKDHENYFRATLITATKDLIILIDHLQARIAFLASDNQSWQDGYQRGLVVGRLAEQERRED